MSQYSKTIKSLRSAGKRNASPIKRADGGAVPDPDDADAMQEQGKSRFLRGVAKSALIAGPLLGSAVGSRMGLAKTFGKVGPTGKTITNAMGAAGGAALGDAMNDASQSVDMRKDADRLRKSPPQSRPPMDDRKRGGRVTKRK